ncbi:hypothetical protein OIU85_029442 [Salix viminalis]|uniref:Uncharacterized protein n=1 Tax=Salix viminalis TaxID=40686 RepID=A0A9Q0T762_SALVM|nr:hypothetical protein OIU85_029442 [Salix viminalis]
MLLPTIVVVGNNLPENLVLLNQLPILAFLEARSDRLNMTIIQIEMCNRYSSELLCCPENNHSRNFLMDEIRASDEAKAIELLNLLPRPAVVLSVQVRQFATME